MAVINKNKKIFFAVFLTAAVFMAVFFIAGTTPVFGADSVDEYNEDIDLKKKAIDSIKEKIDQYNKQIKQKQSESLSLKNQLAILENEIKKNELDIERTSLEIEKLNLEISKLESEIVKTEKNIQNQKKYLAEYIRTININDKKSYLEVLLQKRSFSEFFDQVEYLYQMQNDVKNTLQKVTDLKATLQADKSEMEAKKTDNEKLIDELKEHRDNLDEKRFVKGELLVQSKQSEIQFKDLVYKLKLEEQQINAEITTLERKIRDELEKREAQEKFKGFGPAKFIWPVPSKYVTAYFHDPDYPYRYIFEHPAIDIRASQGTSVKAAESGYVARAKDAGMGYSYIMIIHNDGFSTVYGHVSKILVKEDQYVNKGDIIALSGGKPKTPGAGKLTSGPHLHFEVRSNGIPVNPLEYLP
ncbi:hypothetical protein C4569_00290 [Candidatus Parcubacteria bacterium]|nr:MAG: hypothetical protein C4569_00290 [Candidatus Parcubacteria bacterium]